MAKEIVADITEGFLKTSTQFSDRLVYSNYFIPLSLTFTDGKTPILPQYRKNVILQAMTYGTIDTQNIVEALPKVGLSEVLKKNHIRPPTGDPRPVITAAPLTKDPRRDPANPSGNSIRTNLDDIKNLVRLFGEKASPPDVGMIRVMERKLESVSTAASAMVRTNDRSPTEVDYKPNTFGKDLTKVAPETDEIEFFLGLLKSDVGYLFLDRTRIRPRGFTIGEPVYSLSLAPGEEIVLEQKTFSKRQMTFEEQNEQEKQFDLELSSTLSTELQEGFEREKNRTDTWGLTWSAGAQYSSPQSAYGQVNANFAVGETRNVTDANRESMTRSVKDSQTTSAKVASKYRTLHKTTFKISQEEGFESTSKRVVRNPNRFTPINLHYFKILQTLEMTQERYGVRLCWTPSVQDPAAGFFEHIRAGKTAIIDKAKATIPPPPPEPQPTPSADSGQGASIETHWFWSAFKEADKWNSLGGMSADYDTDIPYDDGYTWDGQISTIDIKLDTKRDKVSNWSVGIPLVTQTDSGQRVLRVRVHIGTGEWVGGPGISFQVGANFFRSRSVTDKTNEDTKYKDDLAAYRQQLKERDDLYQKAVDGAVKAADDWEQQVLRTMNPVTEMISQIIQNANLFPPAVRDECWEIDLWQKLFDWERASYVVFPGWWSSAPMRDPTKDASHFFNASWAKVYLPVRIGMERLALRWIFGKVVGTTLAKEVEDQFAKVEADLSKYRKDTFGGVSETIELDKECKEVKEKFFCIGRWTDLMPTDGTHLEVVQSLTSASDQTSDAENADAVRLRDAVIESHLEDVELKKKAVSEIKGAPTVEVKILTDGTPPTP